MLCMTASLITLTFREPLLEERLTQAKLDVILIGVFFSLDTITFTLTSFALNWISEENKNFKRLVMYGTFVCIWSLAL